MKYDSVLDQQSISGKIVSLILCVWKPCYVKSGHIYAKLTINLEKEHYRIFKTEVVNFYHKYYERIMKNSVVM